MVHAGPAEDQLVEAVAESGALALVTERDVWLLTPREQTYAEAGSDLDSSLVALAIDALPGAEVTYVHDWRSARRRRLGRGRPGGVADPARDRRPDLGLGPRPPADAPQEHVLLSQAPDRDGVQGPRGLKRGRLRNTGAAARPRRSEKAANCAAGALFLYPP